MARGQVLALGARAFDLLIALVEHRDRVVGKDELMQLVWPDTVVGDNNLTVQVSTLRKLMGSQAAVTVPGRGYRFGFEIQAPAEGGDLAAVLPALTLPDKPSVAVLPFLNLSGDARQEYFADSMSEDITTELSRFHSLFVIARNSAFTYKGRPVDVRQVSRELGVRYVVEGSVRRAGQRVRVVAQLIDAQSGEHLWAERYDRVEGDVFDLHEEVTRAIVTAMTPQIDVCENNRARRAKPADLRAHALAQRAWAVASAGEMGYDPAPRDEAHRLAGEALAMDADCALALRTIALVQWWNAYHNTTESLPTTLAAGLAAATRAIALDSGDHHARRWKGLLLVMSQHSQEGLVELRQAHRMNPNCALTLSWLGLYEAMHGDTAQGVPNALEAIRRSPRDPARGAQLMSLAFAQFIVRDYPAAAATAESASREAPDAAVPLVVGAISRVGAGEIEPAKVAFRTLQRLAPKLVEARLAGYWLSSDLAYVTRCQTFLRIAAGLEDPSAADALR